MGSNNFILTSLIGLTLSFVISSSLALDCYSCIYYEGVSADDKCLKDYEDFEVSCEDEVYPPTNPPSGQTGSTNGMTPSTDIPSPSTEIPSPSTDIPSPSTEITPPSTEIPSPSTEITPPSTEIPSPSTEIPSPSTDIPSPSTDIPSPSTDIPSPSTDIPSPSTEITPPSTESTTLPTESTSSSTVSTSLSTGSSVNPDPEEIETIKTKKVQNRFIRSVKPRDGPYYYCAKFETEVASKKVLIRSCVKQENAASENELKKDCNNGMDFNFNHPNGTETGVLTGKLCLCDDDNCNSSTKMTITFGTFGALLGISLFKLFN